MTVQRREAIARQSRIVPEFVQIGEKIIGSAPWVVGPDERRVERFIVFTVRGDKIVDMQGFTSRREAERFANRR